jgi:hypothetical protein
MLFPRFTSKATNMIQANINSHTYFFTVSHITKEASGKLIYGIRLNNRNYFLSKTSGVNDAVQLDTNLPMSAKVLKEINTVITEVELRHKKRQALEKINKEIFSVLIRLRNLGLNKFKPAIG